MTSLSTKSIVFHKLIRNVNNYAKRMSSHFIYYPDKERPVDGECDLRFL